MDSDKYLSVNLIDFDIKKDLAILKSEEKVYNSIEFGNLDNIDVSIGFNGIKDNLIINSGNSGGALIDSKGNLLGITTGNLLGITTFRLRDESGNIV